MEKATPTDPFPVVQPGDTLAQAGLAGADLLALLSCFETIGAWRQVLATGHAYWTPGMYDIFGMPHSTAPANLLMAMERYHEDDRQTVLSHWEESLWRRTPFCFTVRIRRREDYRLVTCIGEHRSPAAGADEMYGLAWVDPPGLGQIPHGRQATNRP